MSEQEIPEGELHIQFSVTSHDARQLDFSGNVSLINMRAWFDNVVNGLMMVYNMSIVTVLRCIDGGPNKINSIKKVRELANISLKEAKDFIESTNDLNVPAAVAVRLIAELKTLNAHLEKAPKNNPRPIIVANLPTHL